jgi:hypothetical protein
MQQICDTQDYFDKKQLGLFGLKSPQQMLNPALKSPKSDDEEKHNHVAAECIKVQRDCMSCSSNQSAILQQIKMACLSYTSTPIEYGDRKFTMNEILKVRAAVIAECQRIVRENL